MCFGLVFGVWRSAGTLRAPSIAGDATGAGATRHLGLAMADVVDGVEPRHSLVLEKGYGMAVALGEQRHQHVGAGHFLAARRLHVHRRALHDALEARGRQRLARRLRHDAFQPIVDELLEIVPQAIDIDAARLLTLRAAWMKDSGQSVNKESAMAKLFASETAVRVADEALQIHGGYGFLKDYPVEKFYRDVKLCTIGEGTSEIQRLVIARQILNTERHHG